MIRECYESMLVCRQCGSRAAVAGKRGKSGEARYATDIVLDYAAALRSLSMRTHNPTGPINELSLSLRRRRVGQTGRVNQSEEGVPVLPEETEKQKSSYLIAVEFRKSEVVC